MNLLQVRTQFRDLTGRWDLVNDDGSDNGADYYINAGLKYLERLVDVQKSYGNYYTELAVGGWYIEIPTCRAVIETWVASTTARWQLIKKDLDWVKTNHLNELVANLDQGAPLYYTPCITRTIGTPPANIANYIDTFSTTGAEYNAIIIMPPPDAIHVIEVKGLFDADVIDANTEVNFWTVRFPATLIKAAMRELEIINNNKSRQDNLREEILIDVDGINKDMVEEESAARTQMEG